MCEWIFCLLLFLDILYFCRFYWFFMLVFFFVCYWHFCLLICCEYIYFCIFYVLKIAWLLNFIYFISNRIFSFPLNTASNHREVCTLWGKYFHSFKMDQRYRAKNFQNWWNYRKYRRNADASKRIEGKTYRIFWKFQKNKFLTCYLSRLTANQERYRPSISSNRFMSRTSPSTRFD